MWCAKWQQRTAKKNRIFQRFILWFQMENHVSYSILCMTHSLMLSSWYSSKQLHCIYSFLWSPVIDMDFGVIFLHFQLIHLFSCTHSSMCILHIEIERRLFVSNVYMHDVVSRSMICEGFILFRYLSCCSTILNSNFQLLLFHLFSLIQSYWSMFHSN